MTGFGEVLEVRQPLPWTNAALRTKSKKLTSGSQKTKVWLNRLGLMLGMAGAVFVGLKAYEYQGQIGFQSITARGFAAMAGLAVAYGASNLLVALAWHNLLSTLKSPVTIRWAIWAHAISQLAKYVPGSVCQFVGRQAIGLAAGLPGWSLVKSTAAEIALLSLCGVVFGILVLPLSRFAVATSLSVLLFCSAIIALTVAIRMLWDAYMATAVVCYLVFLALSGLIFSGALAVAHHGKMGVDEPLPTIVGSYVIAWLAGFLTPGAPAGIGVREVVLIFLFGRSGDTSAILLAIVIGRTITVTGDLLFFASCYASRPNRNWTAKISNNQTICSMETERRKE